MCVMYLSFNVDSPILAITGLGVVLRLCLVLIDFCKKGLASES